MTTYKGLGISIKYGDHSRKIELRVNQHALGVRVPRGDNLRPALLRKLLSSRVGGGALARWPPSASQTARTHFV